MRDLGTSTSTRPGNILKEPDSQKIAGMLWSITVAGGIVAFVAIGYIFRANLFSIGIYSLSFYGVFTITHFIAQMIFASMNQKSWIEKENHYATGDYEPTVSVIIPTYKEDPDLLRACLESIAGQNYTNIVQVILSNDGGDQSAGEIFQEVSRGKKGWLYLFNEHRGKRGAMYSGFNVARGDVIVCMDSDTVIGSESIRELIKPLACEDVGCSTGNIRVLNRGENFLTRLSDLRYWLSFNLERAAQSYFGVVSCVSGPLGAYKRTVIEQVKDSYVRQTFFGNPCTYGDDRHLTNLVLSLGLKSAYVVQAIAQTESPDRLIVWSKQQLRWSRSFFREFLVGLRWLNKHNIWLAFDLTYQATFPFFLGVNVVIILYLALNGTGAPFVLWIGLLVLFGLVRALYGTVSTRDVRFLEFTGYGILYVTILLPLKVYALATLWNPTWGTRQSSQTVPEESSSSRYEVGAPVAVPSVVATEAHEALREAIGELAPVGGMGRETSELQHAAADEVVYYWELGRYSEALASLSSQQSAVPAENLGRWRSWYGRIESTLGPEHPDTLSTKSNIASWMGETGDAREALSLSRELLPDQERALGPEHPETLTTRHNIAYWTGRAGDVGEALRLSKEILPDQERVLGPEHPDTLTTRHNIASWTGRAGGAREALRLFKELLPDRERVLGPEHPGTLATRNNIASWTGETGDAREALRLFSELLPDRERVLGPEHPGTLTTRLNIAYWTGQTGNIREALRLSRELLPDQERVLGPEHPDTLRTRAWMDFLAERS